MVTIINVESGWGNQIYKKHYFTSLKLFEENIAYLSLEVLK